LNLKDFRSSTSEAALSAALESFISEVADLTRGIISDRIAIPPVISEVPGITRQPGCLAEGCAGFLRRIAMPGKVAFFSCPLCHSTFSDVNGEPAPRREKLPALAEAPCPMNCGGKVQKYEGKYGYFWKCSCSPDVTFIDVDGVPAVREARIDAPCPAKGCKGKAVRFERKSDGRAFWTCGAGENFFENIDGVPVLRENKEKRRK
jgi:ssDNA-binding Zn-finger/Zn-ribbon topoisomerase 1